MKKTKTPQTPQLQEPDTQSKRRLSLPKVAYSAFLCVMMSMIADYLPISKIENGIIYTKDHRYVKVVEVVPINFMLRSAQERNIIYSFVSYLKISPIKLQIKVLTRRAEINRHLDMRAASSRRV